MFICFIEVTKLLEFFETQVFLMKFILIGVSQIVLGVQFELGLQKTPAEDGKRPDEEAVEEERI